MALDCIDYLMQLLDQAELEHEFPVSAVVLDSMNTIIGSGYNQKEQLSDPTAHAELLAIRQATHAIGNWRLSEHILVSTLEPCPMCLGAILQARLKKVVFLAKDIRWGACGSIMDFSNHPAINHSCKWVYEPHDDVVNRMRGFFHRQGKRGNGPKLHH